MEKPLINKKYLLEKYPGKGGWTYVVISEIPKERRQVRNAIRVKGTVDGYEIKNYTLMPMADGNLFFPIKTEIRKKIGKEAGDKVQVILYEDFSEVEIPEEFLLCLEEEPVALKNFRNSTDSEKKMYLDWIISAKREETKIDRMAKAIDKLLLGKKFMEK
jgi:hypothetical protein